MVKIFFVQPSYVVHWNTETGHIKVKSFSHKQKGREIVTRVNQWGYLLLRMNNRQVLAHRLVAEHVWGKQKPGIVVNHKDGNKLNNSLANLEFVTVKENIHHAIKLGLHVASNPKRHGNYKDGRALKGNITIYKRNRVRAKLGIKPENYRK